MHHRFTILQGVPVTRAPPSSILAMFAHSAVPKLRVSSLGAEEAP